MSVRGMRLRPVPSADPGQAGPPLAGSRHVRIAALEGLARGAAPVALPTGGAGPAGLSALRAPVAGLTLDRPRVMAILNVTPDSFSDGGDFAAFEAARDRGLAMAAHADILDIGGESTRPGATPVPEAAEIARTAPLIRALREAGVGAPISIDTRKAAVAAAALDAGADIVNDVSALSFDPALGPLVAERGVPLILMHAQGTPETMQDDPRYDDVLLDILDWLEARRDQAVDLGIPAERLVLDPGVGFGKTVRHNLDLLSRVSAFHTLGCAVLVGASRKRFIGTVGGGATPKGRLPGSLAVALAAAGQGVQILRVHDAAETAEALRLATALARPGAWDEDEG